MTTVTTGGHTGIIPTRRLFIKLYACLPSAGIGRTFVEHHVRRLGYENLVDDALLVTGELLSNAIKATPQSERITLIVQPENGGIFIGVIDSNPLQPKILAPSMESEGGRGLFIVSCVAAEYGINRFSPDTKLVWAIVR